MVRRSARKSCDLVGFLHSAVIVSYLDFCQYTMYTAIQHQFPVAKSILESDDLMIIGLDLYMRYCIDRHVASSNDEKLFLNLTYPVSS